MKPRFMMVRTIEMRAANKTRKGKVRHDVLDDISLLSVSHINELARDAESELMAMTVSDGTRRLYTGRWNILQGVLQNLNRLRLAHSMNPVEWSTDLFIIFIRRLTTLDMGRSVAGYLNAVLFMQRSDSTANGNWALKDQEKLHRLAKGASDQSGARRHVTVRGQIDDAMFDSLLEFLIVGGHPVSLVVAMQVAFLCALRISELIRLKHEHVIIESDGSVWLDLPNKAFKKGNGKPPRVKKPVEEIEAMALLFDSRIGKGFGDFLFPRASWNEKMARDVIKAWANISNVDFPVLDIVFIDGPHCLRHDGMKRIQDRVVQALQDVLTAERGACSTRNVKHYARENRVRAKRGRE